MVRTSLFLTAALVSSLAFAGPATQSATITGTGPRGGATAGAYANAEGTGTGKYAAYAVLDFGKLGAVSGSKLKLTLTQADASFSKGGPISFYLCDGSAPTATLKFNQAILITFGSEALKPIRLGAGDFKVGGAGAAKVDVFEFPLSSPVRALLKSSANVRVLILPAGPTVAATYAGAHHRTLKAPILDFTR